MASSGRRRGAEQPLLGGALLHFGIAYVRGHSARDPDAARDLVAAAEARAAKLTSLSGLSPLRNERAVHRRPGPFLASSQVGASRFGLFARRVQRNRARPGR